jgi:hypothetical protein
MRGVVGYRAGVEVEANRKKIAPSGNRTSVVQSVADHFNISPITETGYEYKTLI